MILSGNDYLAKEKGSKAALKNKSNHTSINKNSQVTRRYPKLAKSEGDPALSKINSNKVQENVFSSISFSLSFDVIQEFFFRSIVNQKERREKKTRHPKETW